MKRLSALAVIAATFAAPATLQTGCVGPCSATECAINRWNVIFEDMAGNELDVDDVTATWDGEDASATCYIGGDGPCDEWSIYFDPTDASEHEVVIEVTIGTETFTETLTIPASATTEDQCCDFTLVGEEVVQLDPPT